MVRRYDWLKRRFREVALGLFGYGKGSLDVSSEKELDLRLSHTLGILRISESVSDPIDAICRMLSHVGKMGSRASIRGEGSQDKEDAGLLRRHTPTHPQSWISGAR